MSDDGFIEYFDAKYVGGLIEYPKPTDSRVYIYDDKIKLFKPDIVIPYSIMSNIENMNEDKISAFRVVMLGILGALWKKKHIYTVIQYKDGTNEKIVVLDFGRYIDKAQSTIYKKMVEYKKI